MSDVDEDDVVRGLGSNGTGIGDDFGRTMLSGLALTVPLFITLLVLAWALNLAHNVLSPIVGVVVSLGFVGGVSAIVVEGIAALLVISVIYSVGLTANHGPDTHLGRHVDDLMENLPGIGTIYTSVERMSDAILGQDTHSFREVKLVEFPSEGSFALAFVTADPPAEIVDTAIGEDLVTVFVPLAPNPVMGGHLLTIPRDRLYDVDLTVEQGMEAIMTTGITFDHHAREGTT